MILARCPSAPGRVCRRDGIVNTDEILTIPKHRLDPEPIGALGPVKLRELEAALHYALDLRD